MKKLIAVFFTGMFVSFLGTLPLSTLNLTAMQIGVHESITDALLFSLGALLVEMVYVRISLVGINWIRKQERIMKVMEWIALAIVAALAVGSFVSATKGDGSDKNILLENNMHRLLFGMFLSAINPMQVPFWFGWSTVFFEHGVLEPNRKSYNSYTVGIGLGTMLGNCLFIFGGKWIVEKIANSQQYMNWIIGSIFAITAIIMLIKMLLKKDGVSKLVEKKQQ